MHLAYFGQMPGQGTGSPITMLRHLRRFAQSGAQISVVAEWGQAGDACAAEGWAVHQLPHRRVWWPPFSGGEGWTRALRMRLWAGECARMLGEPSAILTYLGLHSALLPEVAAHYARRAGIPLSVIVHDDVRAFHRGPADELARLLRRYDWILAQAHQAWFVSRELAAAYGREAGESNVLLPIPEGGARFVEWREEFAVRPLIVYAGFLYEQQLPLITRTARAIDRAGGRLVLLVKKSPALHDLCAREPITLQPPLRTNAEAVQWVAEHAAGFLAAYCDRVEDMPWIRSSFPSKVVEFSQLGLPMLFLATQESAIHRWNAERAVPFNLQPTEEAAIAEFTSALRQRDTWERLSQSIRQLADAEFHPERIQRKIAEQLFIPVAD